MQSFYDQQLEEYTDHVQHLQASALKVRAPLISDASDLTGISVTALQVDKDGMESCRLEELESNTKLRHRGYTIHKTGLPVCNTDPAPQQGSENGSPLEDVSPLFPESQKKNQISLRASFVKLNKDLLLLQNFCILNYTGLCGAIDIC